MEARKHAAISLMILSFLCMLFIYLFDTDVSIRIKHYFIGNSSNNSTWNLAKEDKRRPFFHQLDDDEEEKQYSKEPKRILLYTPWFGSNKWWGPRNSGGYNLHACSSNCIITDDKKQFHKSDAAMFHGRDIQSPEILKKLHQIKPQHQIWIWNIFENPFNVRSDLTKYTNLFDWTATYRVKSEIFLPYFRTILLLSDDQYPEIGKNYASGKDKMVLAMISNCVPERMEIVKKLKQFVSFDLMGSCGKVLKQNLTESSWCRRFSKHCDDIQTKYKFYFAMENFYCKDYITEKFYTNGLQNEAVPIVVGGHRGPDFSNEKLAPPKSYINVLDFEDVKSLGDYLNYLNSNDTAYNEYHAWRYTHKLQFGWSMCEVCQKLWNPPKTKTGLKLAGFFSKKKRCVSWAKLLSKFL